VSGASRRWVARAETTVREVLTALGLVPEAARAAIDEGRVFVGRRRARGLDERVRAGEELLLHAPQREELRVALPTPFVLERRPGVVAVHKPAGIPTIADERGGAHALQAEVARAIGVAEAELHPTSRLDREVSGIVIFALDRDAAAALSDARAAGRYERRYVALAQGVALPDEGVWRWSIGRAKDPRLRRAVEPSPARAHADHTPNENDAIPAETRFRVVRRSGDATLLAVAPITGRTHQIRVHASAAGAALLGDGAYGGARRWVSPRGSVRTLSRIALHCARVDVALDDAHGGPLALRAPIPAELADLARWLDLAPAAGEADPLEEAVTCAV
jgi:23S rRNA-/tRNA-specific pseudouridylate synthase